MKTFVLTAMMLVATGVADKANPADFPLTATVKCSFARGSNGVRAGVLLNGKLLELSTPFAAVPLALGEYKMRLVRDKLEKRYEVDQTYEMQLPDGSKRLFAVTGVGDGICATAGSS